MDGKAGITLGGQHCDNDSDLKSNEQGIRTACKQDP